MVKGILKMIKAFKQFTLIVIVMLGAFLNNVYAQSIVFSSDQWPKRWERAMMHRPMNGHVATEYAGNRTANFKNANRAGFKQVSNRNRNLQQGWGQQPEQQRYKRSNTPEYNYQSQNNRFEGMSLQQRYAIPNANQGVTHYGVNPIAGYYGGLIPGYSNVASPFYNGVYPGYAYPNILAPGLVAPGFGGLGFPYGTTPLLMGPGLGYPGGLGYPMGLGYPW